LIGRGHFGKVYKVSYEPELDEYLEKMQLPFDRGVYALKKISMRECFTNGSDNLEHLFNEKFIL
jgi:hypothetical protein